MPYRPELDGLHTDEVIFLPGGTERLTPGDWSFNARGQFVARLPCGDHFFNLGPNAWTVTGPHEAPTLTPSIWCSPGKGPPKEWHGFMTAGQWNSV